MLKTGNSGSVFLKTIEKIFFEATNVPFQWYKFELLAEMLF